MKKTKSNWLLGLFVFLLTFGMFAIALRFSIELACYVLLVSVGVLGIAYVYTGGKVLVEIDVKVKKRRKIKTEKGETWIEE